MDVIIATSPMLLLKRYPICDLFLSRGFQSRYTADYEPLARIYSKIRFYNAGRILFSEIRTKTIRMLHNPTTFLIWVEEYLNSGPKLPAIETDTTNGNDEAGGPESLQARNTER